MKSLSKYLLVRLLLVFIGIWTMCALVLYLGMRNQLKRQLDYRLTTQAEAIASLVEVNPDGSLTMDFVEEFMPEFSTGGELYFQIWLEDGQTFLRSGSLDGANLPIPPAHHIMTIWQDARLPGGQPGRIHWRRFVPRAEDEEHGTAEHDHELAMQRIPIEDRPTVTVGILVPKQEVVRSIVTLGWMLLGSGFGGALLVVVFVLRVVRQALRPLDDLSHSARTIRVRDMDAEFAAPPIIELKDVTLRLNELLKRLRKSLENEQRFSTNVVHDLRTPIAELRTIVDVALRTEHLKPEQSREVLLECRTVSKEMESLVDSIMEMLSFQQGVVDGVSVQNNTVYPLEEIRSCLASAPKRKDSLIWELEGFREDFIETNRSAFNNVIRQLLHNAMEHAPCGSVVSVVARYAENERLVIEVKNNAPELSDSQVAHVFDPFWRAQVHRGDRQHSGLGLAIARAAALALGGSLDATLRDGTVTFRFAL